MHGILITISRRVANFGLGKAKPGADMFGRVKTLSDVAERNDGAVMG